MKADDTFREIDRLYWRFQFRRIELDALLASYGEALDQLSTRKRDADRDLIGWPADSPPARLGIEFDKWIMDGVASLGFKNPERARRAIHAANDSALRIAEITQVRENLRTQEAALSEIAADDRYVALLLKSARTRLLRGGSATKATFLADLARSLTVIEPTTGADLESARIAPVTDFSSLQSRLREDLERLLSWLLIRSVPSKPWEDSIHGEQDP